jgi:hypothetical protein
MESWETEDKERRGEGEKRTNRRKMGRQRIKRIMGRKKRKRTHWGGKGGERRVDRG